MQEKIFEVTRSVRQKFAAIIKAHSIEALNKIPDGFNNNLAWHLGHLVVSTEILCYQRTGIEPNIEIESVDKYRNGSKPESWIDQTEIDSLLARLVSSIDTLEAKYKSGVMTKMDMVKTHTFGVEVNDIETMIMNCALHDTLHWGNIQAMQKLLK